MRGRVSVLQSERVCSKGRGIGSEVGVCRRVFACMHKGMHHCLLLLGVPINIGIMLLSLSFSCCSSSSSLSPFTRLAAEQSDVLTDLGLTDPVDKLQVRERHIEGRSFPWAG